MSSDPVFLTTAHTRVDRVDLPKLLLDVGAQIGAPGYLLNFTLQKAEFRKYANPVNGQAANIDGTTAGRLFGPNAELRWQLLSRDVFDLWTLQETATGTRSKER